MSLKFAGPLPPTPTVNVALVGSPKTGKSTGAASAPGPVLYVNCDLATATRFARLRYPDVQEVEFEGLATLNDVTREAYDPNTKFKTVVIDPIGELYRRLLEEASNRAMRPSLNQYGDTGIYVERFCRAMCEAPVNAVFVCHDHPVADEAAGEIMQLPFTGTSNPKLGRNILGMVDIIAFTAVATTADGPKYVSQLLAGKGRPGGDRFNCLADASGFRETNLSEWVETIVAAESAAAKPQETGAAK